MGGYRLSVAAIVLLAAIAVIDLVGGWLANPEVISGLVMLAIFLTAVVLYVIQLIVESRHRRQIAAAAATPSRMLGGASSGLRWNTVFAASLTVALFANCSSAINSGNSSLAMGGPMTDPGRFWPLAALLTLPLIISISIPAVLVTIAERRARQGRPGSALRTAQRAGISVALIVLAAIVTPVAGFFLGISACFFGTSRGACAAGVGSVMNVFALGALFLFLPYLWLITRSIEPQVSSAETAPAAGGEPGGR